MDRTLCLPIEGQRQAIAALNRLGLTQSLLSSRVGLTRGTVSRFLNGQGVYRQNFHDLCNVLNLDVNEVIDGSMNSAPVLMDPSATLLHNWLVGKGFGAGWFTLDALGVKISPTRFTQEIRRGKIITPNEGSIEQPILFIIGINSKETERVEIQVQLRPMPMDGYLPENLILRFLCGDLANEIQSRSQDNVMQLGKITAHRNKEFSLQVCFEQFCFTEKFRA